MKYKTLTYNLPNILSGNSYTYTIGICKPNSRIYVYFASSSMMFYQGTSSTQSYNSVSLYYNGESDITITNHRINTIDNISIEYTGFAPMEIKQDGKSVIGHNLESHRYNTDYFDVLRPKELLKSIKYNKNNIEVTTINKTIYGDPMISPHVQLDSENVEDAYYEISDRIASCGRSLNLEVSTFEITASGWNVLNIVYWSEYSTYVLLAENQSTSSSASPNRIYTSYDGTIWNLKYELPNTMSNGINRIYDIIVCGNKLRLLISVLRSETQGETTISGYKFAIYRIDDLVNINLLQYWTEELLLPFMNTSSLYTRYNGRKCGMTINGDDCGIVCAGVIHTYSGAIQTNYIYAQTIPIDIDGNLIINNAFTFVNKVISISYENYNFEITRLNYGQYIMYNAIYTSQSSAYNDNYICCIIDPRAYGSIQQSINGISHNISQKIRCVLNTQDIFKRVYYVTSSTCYQDIMIANQPNTIRFLSSHNPSYRSAYGNQNASVQFAEYPSTGIWLSTLHIPGSNRQYFLNYRNYPFGLSNTVPQYGISKNVIPPSVTNKYAFGFFNSGNYVDGYSFIKVINNIIYINIPYIPSSNPNRGNVVVRTFATPLVLY